MPSFYERVDAITKECIIPGEGNVERKPGSFFNRVKTNYDEQLGEEKFINFYNSLDPDEQKEFLVEVLSWAAATLFVGSNKEKNVFLKKIAKPIFVHCLKDQQDKGIYAVPIDLFTTRLQSFSEELAGEFPVLTRLPKYKDQLDNVAYFHHIDIFHRPLFVVLNLRSEESVQNFITFADQFKDAKLKQSDLNQRVNEFNPEMMPHASELFPTKKQPTVVLKVNNFCDGVGDAQTLFTLAEFTRNMLEKKGYRVVGLLELMGGGSKELEIRTYVKQVLEASNPFDMLYILDKNPIDQRIAFPGLEDKIMVSGEERPQYEGSIFLTTECHNTASKDIKENGVLYINILFDNVNFAPGSQGNSATLAHSLTPAGLILDVGELGQIPSSKITDKNHYLSAHIGLPSETQEDSVNGLLLQPQIAQEQLVDELKLFKNQNYIQTLLGSETIDQNVLLEYQKTHSHMIGYLQTAGAGSLYILSTILRYYDRRTRTLSNNCDIHLNAGAIDQEFLQRAFEHLGISNIEFITPSSLESQQPDISSGSRDRCSIRIFSGFRLDHHDYQTLYSLSEEPAGCSGDNSFSDAGQRRLPFPGIIDDKNQFAKDFAKKQLLEFTKAHNLKRLHNYFRKVIFNSMSASIETCFQIATLLKSKKLWEEWAIFSDLLKKQYNYFDNFPGILDKCLRQVSKNTELLENMEQALTSSSMSVHDFRPRL